MAVTDRQPELRKTIARIITERSLGGDYGFDLGPALVPTEQGMAAGYLLIVSCRSPVLLPPRIAHTQLIADPWPDDTVLAAAVGTCLESLAALRAKLLEVPATAVNGRAPGLIR